jgi:hypothetical protein
MSDKVIVIFSMVALFLFSVIDTGRINDNKGNIQEHLELIDKLTECMTELDQRMDSMEDRPEISISYGTVITTEDEIIIQEEEKE